MQLASQEAQEAKDQVYDITSNAQQAIWYIFTTITHAIRFYLHMQHHTLVLAHVKRVYPEHSIRWALGCHNYRCADD